MSDRGPGRPRETSHDEVRTIALDLFRKQGYGKTSLGQIAREAGVSRTTLFAYFPAKRDLIWQDHDERVADLGAALDAGPARPVVDMVVRGMLANASYAVADHALLAARMNVVSQEDELRAYGALAAQETAAVICAGVIERAPEADPVAIELVTRALLGAASSCTEEWALLEQPEVGLDEFIAERIAPVVEALRPLLP